MKAWKFLANDGMGVFSRFAWPLPNGAARPWVESEVDPCRAGIHACRRVDLPYWLNDTLYEIELDGAVEEQTLKVVAPRGRLVRRVDAWNDETREDYSQMCIARAAELATVAGKPLEEWAPAPEMSVAGPALMGFIAARIAEQLNGVDAYIDERLRQSDWLVERLGLD
jgi:hypothetical protein